MLLRRAAFVVIAIFALGLPVLGCGHQVTPERIDTNLAGKMVVRFRTNGPNDFTNLNYVVVLNTCGVGGEPYPNAYTTNSANYSYAFAAGANFGGPQIVLPVLLQYVFTTGRLNPQQVVLSPSTTQFIPDDDGTGTEFQLIFTRAQLNNPLAVASPCPNGVQPTPMPTTPPQFNSPTWYINFFTIDSSNHVQDSLGIGGANDTTFSLPVDTTMQFSDALQRPAGSILPSNPSAQIAGGEIDNYP